MERAQKSGLMVQNMKGLMRMAKNMAKAPFIFQMAVGIKENLSKIIFKAMACTVGLINGNILASG